MTAKHKILVIDDEKTLLDTIAAALQDAGFKVLKANNGQDGYQLALKEHPDLILTDNLMPKMSGIQMAVVLRNDPWGKKVPIIIMTGANDINAINASLAAGVTDYLMKADLGLESVIKLVQSRLKKAAS